MCTYGKIDSDIYKKEPVRYKPLEKISQSMRLAQIASNHSHRT